jgi:hypothetical protein
MRRMNRWFFLVLLALLPGRSVRAQAGAIEPPKLGQPADFSHVVGTFRITAEATPVVLAVEEPLTLTVTILGQAAPLYAPQRDRLQLFPDDVERHFFVEPHGEDAKDGSWSFRYRLRPKHVNVKFVPGLKLIYYAPRQRRYQTAYTDAIPLTVKPRPEPILSVPGLKVMHAPPSFFELAAEETEGGARWRELSALTWFALATLPPLACGVSVWWWQRRAAVHPKTRRQRAAQAVMAQLAQMQKAAETTLVLTDYLRRRVHFPAQEPTPAEVERCLKRCGVAADVRQRWRRYFQAWDAEQYAPNRAERGPARDEAIALIRALEDEPCLASA